MKKTVYTLLLLGACSAALVQTGCKKNPTDGIKLTVDADIIKYNVLIQYVDPSGTVISPVSVPATNVSVGGTNANSVYNIAGKKDYSINGGILTLGLGPDVTPTDNTPASFSVSVNDPRYLPVTTKVKMTPGLKQQIIKVTLVNVSQATPGITFKTGTATLSNDQLAAPVTVSTDAMGSGNTQSGNVSLSAGTQFQDVNGNQLTGSDLKVTIASFDARNTTSAAAFPGGFSADNVNGPNGQGSAIFMTAGFANVSMSLDGQQVKKFSKPITISMTLDPATINPNTKAPVQAGDSIDVYTYDEGTAKWSYETTAAVVSNGSGLSVSYNVQHLTWTNITWTYDIPSCDGSVVFSVPNTTPTTPQLFDLSFTLDGGIDLGTYPIPLYDGESFSLSNSSLSYFMLFGVKTTIRAHGQSTVLATVNGTISPCGTLTNITLSASPVQVITANLYGVCPNKNNQQVRPSFYIYYKDQGAPESDYQLLGYVDKGYIATTAIQLGKTYDFMTYYGTSQVTTTQAVTQTNYTEYINLPDDICNDL